MIVTPVILNNQDTTRISAVKILIFIFLCLFLMFGISSVETVNILNVSVNQLIKDICGHFIETLSVVFSLSLHFDSTRQILSNGTSDWAIVTIERTYPVYFTAVLLIAFLPGRKIFSGIVYLLMTTIFIVIWSSALTFCKIYLYGSIHFVWSLPVEKSVFLPLYFWIFYVGKNNSVLSELLNKMNVKLLNISYFTIQSFLLILILFNAFPFIFLRYLGNSIPFITNSLLKISQTLLSTFGYQTDIIGNKIFMSDCWIKIDPTCIGIGLWILVVFMIINIRGSILNKMIYIPAFTLFFGLTNSLRLAYALWVIHVNAGLETIDYIRLHNNITYLMYIVSFAFLIAYVFWFHNLKFGKFKLKSH